MKRLIACSLGLAAAMAFAFPTPSQFSAAQNDVNELMRTLREDYRAKRKTAVEVADAAHGYLSSADTDAAKFLLYREVICFSARGGDFDKAAQAVKDLESAIDDIPPQKLVDLMREALARKSREEGGALWELFSTRNEQLQLQNKLEKMRAAVEADPAKPTLRVAYAEALAQLGKWKEALAEYAKAGGVYAEHAKAEQSGKGKTFRELGDFWWGYRIRGGKVSPAMKTHAALFYKKAIDSGEATGLVARNLQNRIDEMREELEAIDEKTNPWHIDMKSREPQEMVFDFGNGVKTTFIACRGGEGAIHLHPCEPQLKQLMGDVTGKVRVTRPFWVAKRQVSVAEWTLFEKRLKEKIDGLEYCKNLVEGTDMELYSGFLVAQMVRKYFSWLNETYGSRLPKGWVFRPMTIAESAVVKYKKINPYVAYANKGLFKGFPSSDNKDFMAWRGKHHVPCVFPKQLLDFSVIDVADDISQEMICDRFGKAVARADAARIFNFQSIETDPFWYDQSENASAINLYTHPWWYRIDKCDVAVYARIAVGPDYVGEWKAKHAQK